MTKADPFYRRIEGLVRNEIEGGYFVSDVARGKVHFLNPTAAAVFELCDGAHDADAIASVLTAAFGLAAHPTSDVETCLASLRDEGLIEAVR
ncbi:PqqD family protein [Taklimakanibacter albus]|uniref:PqqD family protein n=1 Tax=Taklimakanibacter albus TaxID=2800327 RepID=A0ACC5RD00_9HYPH|nr:PqqD family protein [Aestuariivirga sp. YIM B02566]MBK1870569.1 PqqD family protein [Aestuariivirga sp. YIM B02566]